MKNITKDQPNVPNYMIHLIVNYNDSFVNWKQIFGQLKLAEKILNRNLVIKKVSMR